MISLEKARALREAGLKWSWQPGDAFVIGWDKSGEIRHCWSGYSGDYHGNDDDIWLPRLDQLLAEIEKRGYEWGICKLKFISPPYVLELRQVDPKWRCNAATPDDAAADALLYLLRQEAG